MNVLTPWRMRARIEWVSVGQVSPLDWEAFPTLKASVVFADVARHELFSTSGTATARISPHAAARPETCEVEVLLPPPLLGYVRSGTQFLVVRGPICIGVGAVTEPGGPTSA